MHHAFGWLGATAYVGSQLTVCAVSVWHFIMWPHPRLLPSSNRSCFGALGESKIVSLIASACSCCVICDRMCLLWPGRWVSQHSKRSRSRVPPPGVPRCRACFDQQPCQQALLLASGQLHSPRIQGTAKLPCIVTPTDTTQAGSRRAKMIIPSHSTGQGSSFPGHAEARSSRPSPFGTPCIIWSASHISRTCHSSVYTLSLTAPV